MQLTSRKTDIDICLVKYAHGVAYIDGDLLLSESFDRTGHEEVLEQAKLVALRVRIWIVCNLTF